MARLGITIDCSSAEEVEELAAFWAAALGYTRLLPDYLADPEGIGPRLAFQIVPDPTVGKLRWHLDLYVDHLDEMDTRVAELVKLGATEVAASTRSAPATPTSSPRCSTRAATSSACARRTRASTTARSSSRITDVVHRVMCAGVVGTWGGGGRRVGPLVAGRCR